MMQKNCDIKGCPRFGHYCKLHYPGLVSRPQNIPKVSEKREIVNRKEYAPLVKELKKGQKACQVNSPVCIKTPVHPHHIKGRIGKQLTKKEDMIMACDPCNSYIESHPEWAKALGFKKTKHQPNYSRIK